MANVTLSIDDELLAKGRSYAQERGTSLNAMLRRFLEETTSQPDALVDEIVSRLANSSGNSGGKKINRDELHRR